MAKLELQNLSKSYSAKVTPLKQLSLSVEDGEFLTLLGPSGCGKSTTLRLIAGLEPPTQGEIRIGGRDVTQSLPGERNIAMVFQSYALYPHMSVYDNIASGLKLRRVASSEIRRQISEVSLFLGLENLMQRRPGQLSGGQRQRVALARALVRRPDVFLLDEPLSNLDALLREQVRAELKQIFSQQNAPIVYVTHDQTEAMTLSSRVAVLNDGLLQQLDSPRRIYSRPANRFVAGFIGTPQMNLLHLDCNRSCAMLGQYKIPLPVGARSLSEVILGIRPEHVRLVRPGDPIVIQGEVVVVENLGMSDLLTVRVEGKPEFVRTMLSPDQSWSGKSIKLSIPPEMIHWFDAQTGNRVSDATR
ncbi:MAG: ABC transporter ATP-binding protein [Pegethrix bostrychoides GSE-TBD4-15B]|jgi:multiple sugar transport system ATP-binding protein|uniref:ABC transporter ATP-binding protein n=1 Tax=Pegethrix bostrychoides GSE-TBD4-15B TaxID=2839662 RepID=A0A951U7L8_9CYAN|nr:ABC transporter ATP-binding protein [Pegethrix bostrychoides GSE-TBD4-15B]